MDWSPESIEYATFLQQLATRMIMVLSILLGFVAYSFFSSLPFDYYLMKSLFVKKPTFYMALNRIAYFASK